MSPLMSRYMLDKCLLTIARQLLNLIVYIPIDRFINHGRDTRSAARHTHHRTHDWHDNSDVRLRCHTISRCLLIAHLGISLIVPSVLHWNNPLRIRFTWLTDSRFRIIFIRWTHINVVHSKCFTSIARIHLAMSVMSDSTLVSPIQSSKRSARFSRRVMSQSGYVTLVPRPIALWVTWRAVTRAVTSLLQVSISSFIS